MGDEPLGSFSLLYEEYLESFPQSRCPIDNEFHTEEGGCYLIEKEDGKMFHVYRQLECSTDREGKLPCDFLKLEWNYSGEHYFENPSMIKLITEVPKKILATESATSDLSLFVNLIRSTLKNFEEVLRPKLKSDEGYAYYFPADVLFDLVMFENRFILLKPVRLFRDRFRFYRGMREVIFELVEMYCKLGELKWNDSNCREVSICNAYSLTGSRNVPKEFRCNASPESCEHIANHTADGKTLAFNPGKGKTCQHLIQKMIVDHGLEKVTELFQFRCHFNFSRNVDVKPMQAFYELFGRTSNAHRLCIPDEFIGDDWYKFLLNVVIQINGDTRDEDCGIFRKRKRVVGGEF